MLGTSKWGAEFLVNSVTILGQSDPTITGLANGRFVVAWTDFSRTDGDTSTFSLRGQVFNTDSSKARAEFLVNSTTANDQSQPAAAALSDGRFVVVWRDNSQTGDDTSSYAVRGQVFNADGSTSGAEFLVNTAKLEGQQEPVVTALDDGRFVVAWSDNSLTASRIGADTSGSAVRGQIFSANGAKSGGEFLINTTTTGDQVQPTITALPDGRFVAAWSDASRTGGDASSFDVRAKIFNANGSTAIDEFLVNSTTGRDQSQPTITTLANGGFVVAWTDESRTDGDASFSAVRGQVFDTNGSPVGTEFLVNTTTTSGQGSPTIAALPDGRFVAAWSDGSQAGGDTSFNDVRGQVFGADGRQLGV